MGRIEQIKVDDETLNAVTCDNVFEKVVTISNAENNLVDFTSVEINLQSVKFVDPYGLVCLCTLGRYLKTKFKETSIVLPTDPQCQAYLRRMKFITFAKEHMEVKNENPSLEATIHSTPEILLELTKIEKKNGNQQDDIKNILARLIVILQHELNFKEKETANLSTIISELCYNIKDHSEDEGYLAVQRYQRRADGKRYVIIGVGDLGIGIRNSLGRRFDVSSWSHLEAIVQALKKDLSTYPDRGLGLYMVSKIMKDYGGALHIRSGNSRLYLRHNPRGVETALFPGTQVSISLSELE